MAAFLHSTDRERAIGWTESGTISAYNQVYKIGASQHYLHNVICNKFNVGTLHNPSEDQFYITYISVFCEGGDMGTWAPLTDYITCEQLHNCFVCEFILLRANWLFAWARGDVPRSIVVGQFLIPRKPSWGWGNTRRRACRSLISKRNIQNNIIIIINPLLYLTAKQLKVDYKHDSTYHF